MLCERSMQGLGVDEALRFWVAARLPADASTLLFLGRCWRARLRGEEMTACQGRPEGP